MLKVLYTLLVVFRRARRAPATRAEPQRVAVDPRTVQVQVVGRAPRSALVMEKLGTIPQEREVLLPRLSGEDPARP
jgi:hypothetical protein